MGTLDTAITLHRPRKAAPEKEARTFQLVAREGAGPVAKIGAQEYGFTWLGSLAGYDLVKPDGLVHEVRRVVPLDRRPAFWKCSCDAWNYSRRGAKTCKHIRLGTALGLIK
jgi:hypothetical protein